MRILLVGGGGREHALAWAIAASPLCTTLFCAPGNAGIAKEATCVPVAAEDVDGLVTFARENAIDFVVVGPEAPLVAGLVDRLTEAGIKAFGPTAAAAALEGSKGFTKDLCAKYGIPTARYRRFTDATEAKAYIVAEGAPIVVKADGLAAGKGVVVAATVAEAQAAVDTMLTDGGFGAAGASIVVEGCLVGPELSFFALCDGETALPLATARDHKRAFDNDEGPNTGGMGAVSPHPLATPELEARIMAEIVQPTLRAMEAEGTPFRGILFAGLMLTERGPQLIEHNVRFGDPECETLLPRLNSDLLTALIAAADGELRHLTLRWRPEAAVTVVMAANGYPGSYKKGSPIRALDQAGQVPGTIVFHAGTKAEADGIVTAQGGRVLAVTALGADIAEARSRAYQAIDRIDWPEGFCRRDIAI
ncbi:phosphoribosylamine--glycine ligase [Mycobacterium sp. KBS0706]|uniref:phosphoribosylamine--glycine ligase n=1 Tax=Mycobacterium sp. KBS0706 TaxID=2578109 RepID=UPI00110F8D04|nr:phosphoribosylamine--glycine ligase [Mycobacterium sp. KBS0706]TSD84565.1 phosphoribosylamine--glycine ligase [Mycobacterium sp. KBS0706]